MHTTFNIVPMSDGKEERQLIYKLQFIHRYGNLFQVAEHKRIGMGMFTCSYEHDVILPIFCLHLIHHDLGELVIHVCFDYDGPVVDGGYRVKHGRVAPSKGHHLVRELFRGVIPSKRFAWTLLSKQVSLKPKRRNTFWISTWAACLPCQAEGREHVPGRGPTGSLVHLDGRKDPETPFECLPCCTCTPLSLWRCC